MNKDFAVLTIFNEADFVDRAIVFQDAEVGGNLAMQTLRRLGRSNFEITARVDFVAAGEEAAFCEALAKELADED